MSHREENIHWPLGKVSHLEIVKRQTKVVWEEKSDSEIILSCSQSLRVTRIKTLYWSDLSRLGLNPPLKQAQLFMWKR